MTGPASVWWMALFAAIAVTEVVSAVKTREVIFNGRDVTRQHKALGWFSAGLFGAAAIAHAWALGAA